ncbi:MAG: hypothetical protein AAF806_08460 [Bacteroidota bacterium]
MDSNPNIIQLLEEDNVLVSVRPNRFFGKRHPEKSPHKFVLVITTNAEQGEALMKQIRDKFDDEIPPLYIESENDEYVDVAYHNVYCKDMPTISKITDTVFDDYNLMSNTRYEETSVAHIKTNAKWYEENEPMLQAISY